MLDLQDLILESKKSEVKSRVPKRFESKRSVSKKICLNVMGSILLFTTITGCSGLSSDHQLCDLRVLALQINQQSADATIGTSEAIQALKKSQEKLSTISPKVIKHISNEQDAKKLQADIETIQSNIKVIVDNKTTMTKIYDFRLMAGELIPSIQAEYNLITDIMVRNNYASAQVMVAKNQVFIAERILRSIYNLNDSHQNSIVTSEDLVADIETLNTYLKAQLDGSSELGIQRVNDPALRESLMSIKQDTDQVLMVGINQLRMDMQEMEKVQNAVKKNQEKAMDVFNTLEKLEVTSK